MCGCNDTNEERRCCAGTTSRRKQCCLDASHCTGERPPNHPRKFGKCQCAAEASWERCSPPRPKRDWASNFSELRRRWSEHAKRQNCPCDDCKRKTIQPLEDSRQICRNEEHFDNDVDEEEDPGYRSSSNRGCSRASRRPYRSPESRCDKSSRSCTRRHDDEKFEGYCLCQPHCCAVRIDARSRPECTCECSTSVECPCPPSERRFPRSTKCCVVAESCTTRSDDDRKTNCLAVKSKSSCVKLPTSRNSKRNSCSTSPDRSECCRDRSTCLSMVERVGGGCRGDNSTGHQSRARRQQRATWERTTTAATTTTAKGEERPTTDNRTCGSECRPIVYERGELLIIEDLARVCDNESPNRQLRKVTSQGSCKQSRRRSRTPPRKQCNFHSCTCTTTTTTPKKKTLNCATQVSRRKLTLAKIAPCDYTVERRKCSSKEIQVGGRGVDACVGCEKKREDAVTNKSSKRLKRTKAKNNLNDARVEQISKIDLRCTKYITSSADKKRKKSKHCKCPPTCKYYVGPRKAASEDHPRLLSKSKKSKKKQRDKKIE